MCPRRERPTKNGMYRWGVAALVVALLTIVGLFDGVLAAKIQRLRAIFREAPTVGPDQLDALDQEVDEMCAWALEHTAHETMELEQFQVFSGIVTQVRRAIDKRRALLR